MNRRRLLRWLGVAGAGAAAGCSNQEGPATASSTGRGPTRSPTATASPTRRTATETPTRTETASDSPTATERESVTETPSETETVNDSPTDTDTESPTETESPTAEETGTPTPGEGLQRTVSVASVDSVPSVYEVEMDVELLRSRITDARSAHLRITTTNTGSRRSISVAPDDCSLLNRSKGGSDQPSGLWLHDPDTARHIDRDGNRWEADRDPDEGRAYAAYGCLKKEYAEGESVSNEYVLWSDYRVEGYLEPGTYRWEEEVSVSEGDTPTGTAGENTFMWGFSLSVSEP